MFPLIEYDTLLATLMGMFSGELRRKIGALKYDLGWMVSRIEAMSADNEKYHADKVALADYCSEIGLHGSLTVEQLIVSHKLHRGLLALNRKRVAELLDIMDGMEREKQELKRANDVLVGSNDLYRHDNAKLHETVRVQGEQVAFAHKEIANLKERNEWLATGNLVWKEKCKEWLDKYTKLYFVVKTVKEAVE